MPKLYGVLEAEDRLKVEIVSYSGNRPGFVEVEEVLEDGDGQLYVNPLTGEQWFEEIVVVEETITEEESIEDIQQEVGEIDSDSR